MSGVYPLISVIVPMYNCEKTIEDCLKSIVEQTYPNIEILAVDDKSTDGTVEICRKLVKKYSNIKLFEQNCNKGVSSSRNIGIENAKGDYIAFCDSDDVMKKNMLSVLAESMMKYGVMVVCCAHSRSRTWITYEDAVLIEDKKKIAKAIYEFGGFVWNKLFDKRVIGSNRFNENLTLCEDTVFVLQCLSKNMNGSILYIPDVLYEYNTGGITTGVSNRHFADGRYMYDCAMKEASSLYNDKFSDFYKHVTFMLAVVERDFDKRYKILSEDNKKILNAVIKENRKNFLRDKDISLKKRVIFWVRYLFPYSKFFRR